MRSSPRVAVAVVSPQQTDAAAVGRSTAEPENTAADAAATCAGIPEREYAAATLYWGRDGHYIAPLMARLHLAAVDLSIAEGWKMPRGKDRLRKMVRCALLETADPSGLEAARAALLRRAAGELVALGCDEEPHPGRLYALPCGGHAVVGLVVAPPSGQSTMARVRLHLHGAMVDGGEQRRLSVTASEGAAWTDSLRATLCGIERSQFSRVWGERYGAIMGRLVEWQSSAMQAIYLAQVDG